MKKYTATVLALLILLLASWSLVYEPYIQVQEGIARTSSLGDYSGALELIRVYRSTLSSYVICNTTLLDRFRMRLLYNEGVVHGMLGDASAAEAAFRESAQSDERAISASSLYNLALLAIERGQLEIAMSHLGKSLGKEPSDIAAKANLELVIRRLRAASPEMKSPGAEKRDIFPEQWRDMPSIDGPSVPGPRRSYL